MCLINTQYKSYYIFSRPFERTAADNDKIFSILKTFEFFADNISNNVLKELCVVAQLETWKEQDFTGMYCSQIVDLNSFLVLNSVHTCACVCVCACMHVCEVYVCV